MRGSKKLSGGVRFSSFFSHQGKKLSGGSVFHLFLVIKVRNARTSLKKQMDCIASQGGGGGGGGGDLN